MNNFLIFISENFSAFLVIVAIIILLSLAANIFSLWQIFSTKRRLKHFFEGRKAKDLEELLAQQIKRQIKSENEIKELFKSSRDLWKIANKSVQKVGVVRYNPFKDTGGDQSFAIALLDLKDTGIVISSLYSREGTRVYSKPIEKGKSKYQLTEEERKAIEKAKTTSNF